MYFSTAEKSIQVPGGCIWQKHHYPERPYSHKGKCDKAGDTGGKKELKDTDALGKSIKQDERRKLE